MKGIVFNLLEEVVTAEFGAATWDMLLEGAGVDGAFTSLGNYPDEQLVRLVGVAATALKMEPAAVVRWFGIKALPLFARRYRELFDGHTSARTFVLTLNNIIHPEVRKLYPGADVPDFEVDASNERTLVLGYRSARQMCALAEGLVTGAAEYFGETAVIRHPRCLHRNDDHCRLEITFERKAAAA